MKKLIFFISFLITLSAKGQTNVYHPFPDSGAVWTQYDGYCENHGPFQFGYSHIYFFYKIDGDSIINSNYYHKIYRHDIAHCSCSCNYCYCGLCNTSQCGRHTAIIYYVGALRQEVFQKKVYFLNSRDSVEYLLYDFSVQAGEV